MTASFILREPEMLGLFILLIPFIALAIFHIRRRNRDLHSFIPSKPGKVPLSWNQKGKIILSAMGTSLLIFSLSRPAINPHPEELFKKGSDLVFLLDVSNSMLARDLAPNRLERAKTYIQDCVISLKNHRFGLVVFAGSASIKCPLTSDLEFFLSALESCGPDSVAHGGTRISDAILKTCDKIFSKENQAQNIILISDGGNQAKSLKTAVEIVNKKEIRLFCLGLGDSQIGARIPDVQNPGKFLQENGREVWTKLETDKMQSLVRSCKGAAYIPAGTKNLNLAEVYRDLQRGYSSLQKSSHQNVVYDDIFHYFLFAGLILILASILVDETKATLKTSILALCFFIGSTYAEEIDTVEKALQEHTELVPDTPNFFKLANYYYQKKKFLNAAESYQKALNLTQKKSERITLSYNKAVALHQAALSDEIQRSDDSAPISLSTLPSKKKLAFINKSLELYRLLSARDPQKKYLDNLTSAVNTRQVLLKQIKQEEELMKEFDKAVKEIRAKLEKALSQQNAYLKSYYEHRKSPVKDSVPITDKLQLTARVTTMQSNKLLEDAIEACTKLAQQTAALKLTEVFVDNAVRDQQACIEIPFLVDKEAMGRRAKQEIEKALASLNPETKGQKGEGQDEKGDQDANDGDEGEDGEEGDEESENMDAADLDSSELAERDSQELTEPQDSADDLIKREKQLQKSRVQNVNRGSKKQSKQGVTW